MSVQTVSVYPAHQMDNEQRESVALEIISGNTTITEAANEHNTSRKFIREQKEKGLDGIRKEFHQQVNQDFINYLPICKSIIHQIILTLILIGRTSFRSAQKIIKTIFNYHVSVGTVFNVVHRAIAKSREINSQQDLSAVEVAALDELFHGNKPILSGVDVHSLYCFLLSDVADREGPTWEKYLNLLKSQGLDPKHFIADFGEGLRAGLRKSYEDTECYGDVFHMLYYLKKLGTYFKNRLKSRITYRKALEKKMDKAKNKSNGMPQKISRKLGAARKDEEKFRYLSENLNTLVSWMAHDVLSFEGSNLSDRMELYDFIVEELRQLSKLHPWRITPVITSLVNQRDETLLFVKDMEVEFQILADFHSVDLKDAWLICELQRCERLGEKYCERAEPLKSRLGDKFYFLMAGVRAIISKTVRASSLVENLNGRVRLYVDLRQNMGNDYLELLRFFLNHSPLTCSVIKERKNKTPSELLTGEPHAHWLEMLGYDLPELIPA